MSQKVPRAASGTTQPAGAALGLRSESPGVTIDTAREQRFAPHVDAQLRLLDIVRSLTADMHAGGGPAVSLDSRLEQDLGLDSLSRMELLLRVERAFGVALPEQALVSAETPRDLLLLIGRGAPPAIASLELRPLTQGPSVSPSQAQTLTEVLDWHASIHPGKLHVHLYGEHDTAEEITYADLREGARAVAAGLVARGVEPGHSVAIMLPTGKEYLFSFFGILIAGGIPVPIYPPARWSQIEDHLRRHGGILANSRARLLITVPQAKPLFVLLRAQTDALRSIATAAELAAGPRAGSYVARSASDLAFIQYTSGSTGNPKGVSLTHANLLANIRAMGTATQVQSQDVFVSWLPLYHDMGLIGAWLGSLYYGMPLALMSPLAFLARPSRWLWAIHRHAGTLSAAPNFAYDLCARKLQDADLRKLDLSSLRAAFNGSEPVSADTLEAFAARFASHGLRREALTPVYGLAESSVGLTFPPLGRGPLIDVVEQERFLSGGEAIPASAGDPRAMRIVSCGRPLPGHQVRIVDANGREVADRTEGRLEFRGPSATSGYFRSAEQTRKLFHGDWLDSGDCAYVANGEVYITGRVKDVIIRGGRHIFPYDLEQAIGNIRSIRKGCVAVFGSPDPVSGTERLIVLAETRESGTRAREGLVQQINVAAMEVVGAPPDEIVLVPAHTVLKTSSGKIRRAASREYYERRGLRMHPPPAWLQFARLGAAAVLPELRRRARGIAALLYAGYAWVAFLLVATPTWVLVALARRPAFGRRVCHDAARLLSRLTGIRVGVAGLANLPRTPHLLASNHASYIDAILLAAVLPPEQPYVFVAKREFARQPVARRFLAGIAAAFVERSDAKQGVEDVAAVEQAARNGALPLFFPEGTFDRQPGLREFRMGAFLVAARARVPIVPLGIRGARSILREGTWFPRGGPAAVAIGTAIAPAGGDWAAAVALRDRVRAEIARLSGEPERVG
jgi:1-acyl-sn-glycerol-3-phosphate acyltransferase